jgi:hypothetical protein
LACLDRAECRIALENAILWRGELHLAFRVLTGADSVLLGFGIADALQRSNCHPIDRASAAIATYLGLFAATRIK